MVAMDENHLAGSDYFYVGIAFGCEGSERGKDFGL